jgi:hypothetical protein
MADRIRIIPHEAVPLCGSFEVRFPDGRPSQFSYWDDMPTMLVMRTLVFGAVLLVIASAGFHSLISASLAAAQDAKATTFSERLCPALKSPLG